METTKSEEQIIEAVRSVEFGEVTVFIQYGKPQRFEAKISVKTNLDNNNDGQTS